MGAESSKEEEFDDYDYEYEYESRPQSRRQQNRRRQNKQRNQGAVNQGGGYQGAVYQDIGYQGAVHQSAGYQGAVHQGAVHQGAVHQGAVHQGAVHQGAVNRGAVHQNGGRRKGDAAYQQKQGAGGNRNWNRNQGANQPPQYEEVIKQTQFFEQKTPVSTGSNVKEPYQSKPGDLGVRGPKTVDALNDMIRKEFGSVGGPTFCLPIIDTTEKPFAGRNRLYLGNLPSDVSREDFNELMSPYGEIVIDIYNNEKHFGFIRLKHREQAENAQRTLDGHVFKGRTLRVRFANKNPCFKVKNLSPLVTNELLKKAFSSFGEVERAEVVVENGKSTGDGYVEFSEKRAGELALEACVEGCFILTKSLRPVILEEVDPDNGQRGLSERQLQRNDPEYKDEREVGPRFIAEGSSEYACALLWKSLYERRRYEEEELASKFKLEEELILQRIKTLSAMAANVRNR